MDYLLSKPIPDNILSYIADVSMTSAEQVNSLYHDLQMYSSVQSQLQLVITMIIDRILAFFDIMREQQPDTHIDINDPSFVRSFINKLKRSTLMLKAASDDIFAQRNYDRFLILYFAFIVTLFVDSLNHNGDYYLGNGAQAQQTDISQIDNTLDQPEYNDDVEGYAEAMEAMFDGIVYDEDFLLERK